jgi:serine/threonine-protein kinase RsbW
MTSSAERKMELTLPMVPDIEIAAARAAGNLARELGMSANKIDEMTHAIIEACINAREHSGCADQRIYLRFRGTSRNGNPRIEIWISDHGRGFDQIEARRLRLQQQGVTHKRGWGLQIIEAHMDEVDIVTNQDGTTIHMVKVGEKEL